MGFSVRSANYSVVLRPTYKWSVSLRFSKPFNGKRAKMKTVANCSFLMSVLVWGFSPAAIAAVHSGAPAKEGDRVFHTWAL